jgi:hypothetical protein
MYVTLHIKFKKNLLIPSIIQKSVEPHALNEIYIPLNTQYTAQIDQKTE